MMHGILQYLRQATGRLNLIMVAIGMEYLAGMEQSSVEAAMRLSLGHQLT